MPVGRGLLPLARNIVFDWQGNVIFQRREERQDLIIANPSACHFNEQINRFQLGERLAL